MSSSAIGKHYYWLGKKREPVTQEVKDKISNKLKGRKLTPEHIKNIVEARIRNNQKRKQEKENIINNNNQNVTN